MTWQTLRHALMAVILLRILGSSMLIELHACETTVARKQGLQA